MNEKKVKKNEDMEDKKTGEAKMPSRGETPNPPQTGKRGAAVQIHTEKTRYGIRIVMPESLSDDGLLRLLMRIPAKAYRLPDAEGVALDFLSRACSQEFLAKLLWNIVWKKKVRVLAWLSTNEESVALFRDSGFSVTEPGEADKPKAPPKEQPKPEDLKAEKAKKREPLPSTKFVYGSMRSGRIIEVEGDVIVWGHMNPGAEIIAGGSVVVAGRLQGLVHAGREGRKDAFIFAGAFETTQVRLANRFCSVDENGPGWGKSVLITFGDDEGALDIRENDFLSVSKGAGRRRLSLPFIGKKKEE